MTTPLWLPQAAAAPNPQDLAAYLLQKQWQLKGTDKRWAVFAHDIQGETVELEVPQQSLARDYGRSVAVLIEDLARIERRDASVVLRDIHAVSLDVVRIAIEGSSTRDGRISVEAGRRVYAAARDMLLAAACSVIDPRPVFPTRKPDEATNLLRQARFGQTEFGSFVLTMECAIAPRLQATLLDDDDVDADAPLERKTCIRLAEALLAAEDAARESAASGLVEPFRQRASQGVSANLCEALVEMMDATAADVVKAGFAFAPRRPLRRAVPQVVAFSADTVGILRAAAARLREEATYPATDVVGIVVKLDSADPTNGGDAVLRANVEGRMRAVKVRLDAEEYKAAIGAHGQGALVRCVGDLTREGRSWMLRHARDFVVMADTEGS